MSTLLWVAFAVGLSGYGYWRDRHLVRAAYLQGKRAGLKAAIEVAKERGDTAALCAPEGSLTLGLVRAQAVHNVELELRAALSEVR
jgi:hypothetical protein